MNLIRSVFVEYGDKILIGGGTKDVRINLKKMLETSIDKPFEFCFKPGGGEKKVQSLKVKRMLSSK